MMTMMIMMMTMTMTMTNLHSCVRYEHDWMSPPIRTRRATISQPERYQGFLPERSPGLVVRHRLPRPQYLFLSFDV